MSFRELQLNAAGEGEKGGGGGDGRRRREEGEETELMRDMMSWEEVGG